jgi:hypothetical protein
LVERDVELPDIDECKLFSHQPGTLTQLCMPTGNASSSSSYG